MRIYLDVCCLNRPFDDQTSDRIGMESQALSIIISHIEQGEWEWIKSEAVDHEIDKTPDLGRVENIKNLIQTTGEYILIDEPIICRAEVLQVIGFRAMDSLHLACAESGKADILLTTDDQFFKLAKRVSNKLDVQVANPLQWLREELKI